MSLEVKNNQGRLPRFPRFYLGETAEGTGRGRNQMKQGQGKQRACFLKFDLILPPEKKVEFLHL